MLHLVSRHTRFSIQIRQINSTGHFNTNLRARRRFIHRFVNSRRPANNKARLPHIRGATTTHGLRYRLSIDILRRRRQKFTTRFRTSTLRHFYYTLRRLRTGHITTNRKSLNSSQVHQRQHTSYRANTTSRIRRTVKRPNYNSGHNRLRLQRQHSFQQFRRRTTANNRHQNRFPHDNSRQRVPQRSRTSRTTQFATRADTRILNQRISTAILFNVRHFNRANMVLRHNSRIVSIGHHFRRKFTIITHLRLRRLLTPHHSTDDSAARGRHALTTTNLQPILRNINHDTSNLVSKYLVTTVSHNRRHLNNQISCPRIFTTDKPSTVSMRTIRHHQGVRFTATIVRYT